MHEYSIVSALMEQVGTITRRQGATAVHAVRVRIGELAGVEPDLFGTAFELLREGTPCSGARLEVVAAPAVWTCPLCSEDIPSGHALRCPTCGSPARLAGGDEIILERLEMEVPETDPGRAPETTKPEMEVSDV